VSSAQQKFSQKKMLVPKGKVRAVRVGGAFIMTHHVQIRITPGAQTDSLTEGTWFKQTTKINGVKTTSVFQRPDKPRDFGQKVIDFFSGIKKAKNSITLCEAFKQKHLVCR
jgi:hypothetical protein